MMPAGTELNAAVAKAMGLQEHYEHDCNAHWMRYSADPKTIPEMLAWLHSRWRVVFIQRVTGLWDATACAIEPDGERLYAADEKVKDCESIQHALANLVVAASKTLPDVAKPRSEGGA